MTGFIKGRDETSISRARLLCVQVRHHLAIVRYGIIKSLSAAWSPRGVCRENKKRGDTVVRNGGAGVGVGIMKYRYVCMVITYTRVQYESTGYS